jgi:hypothetical protein
MLPLSNKVVHRPAIESPLCPLSFFPMALCGQVMASVRQLQLPVWAAVSALPIDCLP